MKVKNATTNFARCVTRFLTSHLPGERNLSSQTIKSYSQALKMYIGYLDSFAGIKPERIEFKDVTAESIKGFLASMGNSECISPNTHNQRLSALKSFVRYAILEYPAFLQDGQRVLAIPSKRRSTQEIVYLEKETMRALLEVPDQTSVRGRRDLAIMSVLYDTGARIQEFINLKVKDVRLLKPEMVTLHGKGRKMRTVPIMTGTARIIEAYMHDRGFLEQSACGDIHLFSSVNRAQFTRPGITRILKRHFATAKAANSTIPFPKDIHPHVIRASRAIHLLESGVNIIAIRDFLGHTSVTTTQVYLRVNNKAKQDAIIKAYPPLIETVPAWRENNGKRQPNRYPNKYRHYQKPSSAMPLTFLYCLLISFLNSVSDPTGHHPHLPHIPKACHRNIRHNSYPPAPFFCNGLGSLSQNLVQIYAGDFA